MKTNSVFTLACVLISTVALAQQVNMGAVNGTVTDSTGASIPNVKVTAISPALQGEAVFVTNETGNYRFPALPLGLYRFSFEASGFATQVREQVNVTLNFAATINVQLTPAAQQQTVVVTGETPLIDTQNTSIQAGFNLQQLNEVPNGRDMWSVIGLTPGMNNARLDVGGSQVGNQVPYTSFGYGGQNRVMIDGINTSEGTSGAGFYFDYGSFSEFTAGTAANDASMPVPGNQINAVIKTGGNQYHGDVYFDYESPSFQGTNISQKQILQGAGLGQRIASYYDPNGDFGGPILKDRWWFFISLRDQTVGASVTGFPIQKPGTVNSYAYDRNATYKLTGAISNKHHLSHYIQWNPILKPQRNSTAGDYEDAMYYQKAMAWVGNVQYNSVWTPRFFTNVLIGTWGYNFPQVPYGVFDGDPGTSSCPCAQTLPRVPIGQFGPRMTELTSNDLAGAFPEVRLDPRRYQFEPSGSYFLDNFLHANHQLKFGYLYEREIENDQYYAPVGGATETFKSAAGLPDYSTPYQVTITNNARIVNWVILHHGAYITDQVKLKRVTLNIGVRWDYYSSGYRALALRKDCEFCGYFYLGQPLPNGATIPANTQLVNGKFPDATISTFPREFAPRIGVAYDLTGKGRTLLKLNYGRFYSFPSTNIASAVAPLQASTAIFNWNNPNNLPFNANQLGSISGSPNVPTGSFVQPGLKDESFDDLGAVVQHQLSDTLSIEGGFIFRELHYSPETINVNLPSSLFTIPVQEQIPTAFDAGGNVSATKTITMWDVPKNQIIASKNEIASPNGNNQIFRNFELVINKRLSRRFTAVGSFYWTRTTSGIGGTCSTCTAASAISNTGVVTNGVALNPDQLINSHQSYKQWTAHIDGSYDAPWGIRISPVLRMQSGAPLTETYPVTGLNIGTFYLPVTPTGTFYNPDLYVFDTRVEKYLTFHERFRLGLFLDIFNVFNSNTANTLNNLVGVKHTTINIPGNPAFGQNVAYQGFGSPNLILPPRILRLGARFTF
jgi:hypothetical protein